MKDFRRQSKVWLCVQRGVTMVELMISLTVGLFIVLAATALFLASKNAYTAQVDQVEVQETGRYSVELVTRAIHQAAYENWDKEESAVVTSATLSANIQGLDARSLRSSSPAMESPLTTAVNGSDVLATRFFGAGTGAVGDGTMLNCAGLGVPESSAGDAEEGRGWSIFYVAKDSAGEPELRCKYKGKHGWNSDAIARGVESFQVLYGLDTDDDGLPNQFLTATEISLLDRGLILSRKSEAERMAEKDFKSHWKEVVAIKIGLLIRGREMSGSAIRLKQYDLFGADYGDLYGRVDHGSRIVESDLLPRERSRLRKVFGATIYLRNVAARDPV